MVSEIPNRIRIQRRIFLGTFTIVQEIPKQVRKVTPIENNFSKYYTSLMPFLSNRLHGYMQMDKVMMISMQHIITKKDKHHTSSREKRSYSFELFNEECRTSSSRVNHFDI